MKCAKETMLLYAVTDRSWTDSKSLKEQVEEALQGGITCLQLREKNMDPDCFLKEAKEIHELCQSYNVPLIINDNVQVALKSGAEGVHIGQKDGTIEQARKVLGPAKIIGVSVHTPEEAIKAQLEGADYLGVGAVFKTTTKKDAKDMNFNTLAAICKACDLPITAIGGINETNILKLSKSGVDGVAVVSAIFAAKDIKQACITLKSLSQKII